MGTSKSEQGKCKNKGDLRRMFFPILPTLCLLRGGHGVFEHGTATQQKILNKHCITARKVNETPSLLLHILSSMI